MCTHRRHTDARMVLVPVVLARQEWGWRSAPTTQGEESISSGSGVENLQLRRDIDAGAGTNKTGEALGRNKTGQVLLLTCLFVPAPASCPVLFVLHLYRRLICAANSLHHRAEPTGPSHHARATMAGRPRAGTCGKRQVHLRPACGATARALV